MMMVMAVVLMVLMVMVVMVIEMTVMVEVPEVLVQSQNLFQTRSQAGLVNLTTFPDHLRCGEEFQ